MIAIDNRRTRRLANAVGLAAIVGLMAYALYAEHILGLAACPLCIFQRIAFIALGIVFLVAAAHGPAGAMARIYATLGAVAAGTGASIAGRHFYIQNLPADQVPACGPDLAYMLDVFPLSDVLIAMTQGTGDCAEVVWSFLGLSIPGWALLTFALIIVVALLQLRAGAR